MEPVKIIDGKMCPLNVPDVDTDQIMPKQFLKKISRTGFADCLFYEWRKREGFVLTDPRFADAQILIAGKNFGCGSSREHAPWGLQQFGFRAIIAPSFADIFKSNCSKTGLLTLELAAEDIDYLAGLAETKTQNHVRIDLEEQSVEAHDFKRSFTIDGHTKFMLFEGLDDIGLTLQREELLTAFEAQRQSWLPVTSVPSQQSHSRL